MRWTPLGGHSHTLAYHGIWRQITGLAEKASPLVRNDAGDSFKSSMVYTWIKDRRNNPLLPTSGYLMKSVAELAGFGPLKGDVAFAKLEVESQAAIPVPVPFVKRDLGISLTAGLRGGLLYPLQLANGDGSPTHSRINDRFMLGGPTDVRGFRLAGLGPRDGEDFVGGDVYAAGGVSLYLPFPRVGKDVPLRLQLFVNGGRLLGLQDLRRGGQGEGEGGEKSEGSPGAMTAADVQASVKNAVREIGKELPSLAAGVGVVYAMPVARLELNFSVPLVVREGEGSRKGLGLGVGVSFL